MSTDKNSFFVDAKRVIGMQCNGQSKKEKMINNYFVQSDWRTMVQNLELPYNVKLKAQVVTHRVLSGFKV
jgi:hypothetical protein